MKFSALLNIIPSKNTATKGKNLLHSYSTNGSCINVFSSGKIDYIISYESGLSYHRCFYAEDCIKYFPYSMYKGLSNSNILELDDSIVFTIYGEYLIENSRNDVHTKRSVFSLNATISDEDSLTFEDTIEDRNAILPENELIKTELCSILSSAISDLTLKEQEVINRKLAGMTDVEIASELNIDPTSVRDRKKNAFKKLCRLTALRDLL